jgi:hypothetical protein
MDAVAIRLGLPAEDHAWLAELASLDPTEGLVLPAGAAAEGLLTRLGLAPADVADMLPTGPDPARDPELWWLLARAHRQLVVGIGTAGPMVPWRQLPESLGPAGHFLFCWVFLAALDPVRDYHRGLGIPDAVSWATLADLGQQMGVSRLVLGRAGLAVPNWLTLHFRGAIYALGRLQFQRVPQEPVLDGQPALSVHIPATGPMTPEACDESFAAARPFFDRYFPEEGYRHAICHSWLLDEQLADYLPADSNIVRFQRRFRPVPPKPDEATGDQAILEFVFRRRRGPLAPGELDRLPQRTSLERAVVTHLRAGRHWRVATGWCPL